MVEVAFSAGLTAKNDLKQCDDAFIDLQGFSKCCEFVNMT